MSSEQFIPHGLRARLTNHETSGHKLPKFQVEGPWNIGDPVHETITNLALQRAGIVAPGTSFQDRPVWEYIRGVIWNDDPEGLLFDHNETETDNWSSGVEFVGKFNRYQGMATDGTMFGPSDPLLARSHFGDLQCLHAMATRDGEAAHDTRHRILLWSEFFYGVATGHIDGAKELGTIDLGQIELLFPNSHVSVRTLFLIGRVGDLRHRAMGALLHMIEDSYAKGHVQRDVRWKIQEFHSYINQDSHKHGDEDVLAAGGIDAMPGAKMAVRQCAEVLKMWKSGARWEQLRTYLEDNVFQLLPTARPASPGDEFRKNLARPMVSGTVVSTPK